MKNTATLGQIQKILTFLDNIPSERVQKVIESGFLSDVIRKGESNVLAKQMEMKRLEEVWKLIGVLTQFETIIITVPHIHYQHAPNDEKCFQLRCWHGEHGHVDEAIGHVNSAHHGELLFETYIPEKLEHCQNCWIDQLRNIGLCFDGDYEWVLDNMGTYDTITRNVRR